MNNGELVKPEDDNDDDEAQDEHERNFVEAFKSCTTPLHVAAVLGFSEIVEYLILECNADPNYQTKIEKYSTLHLCVLANRPELIMSLIERLGA